ncbi:unnamed protein product [Miscanthus lutarioriparius]|uniref:Extra-large guanine nucleotide-binding protein 3 n=1 Tax=Miscanthus lutarioriparius TaxID=422564 RepID=A0A811SAH0_9POAL|nr:unnamed protein product [Miscanthus lutarioriparius]
MAGAAAGRGDWEDLVRRMFPPGTTIPEAPPNLDYSIALEYDGPDVSYELPRIDPVCLPAIPTAEPVSGPLGLGLGGSGVVLVAPVIGPAAARARAHANPPAPGASRPGGAAAHRAAAPPARARRGSSPSAGLLRPEGRRPQVVTFGEPEDSRYESQDFDAASAEQQYVAVTRPAVERKGRRTCCHRCGKSKWESKESCIVCDARYCGHCLLRAMGSMPEGRKCVTCIGRPIDEAKRPSSARAPGYWRRLLSPLEVRQILKVEKECQANQLRPEQLVVNGFPLHDEEMADLLSCQRPPGNLKPGRYWYDKESGLWGKEGEKPDRIISTNLNFNGKLQPDASNGTARFSLTDGNYKD